jgi:hypothetical protein
LDPVLVGALDDLKGVDSEAVQQSIQLAADCPRQQIHMVSGDPIVVLRALLELLQASSAQAGADAVEPAQNSVGEMRKPKSLLLNLRRGRSGDLHWVHQGSTVR